MIIYIASYPRSGNSLVQQLIQDFFGRPVSAVYAGKRAKVGKYASGELGTIQNWRPATPRPDHLFGKLQARWNPLPHHLASYDLRLPCGGVVRQEYLVPGCSEVLTERNRRRLAQSDSVFFIKTHKPPFRRYLPGERIIIPVRHPGAVLSSLRHFMRDHRAKELTMAEVITGRTPNGCWSEWHNQWLATLAQHPSQGLILRFEETVADPRRACESISDFLGLPFDREVSMKDFATLHKSAPKHIRSGKADGWESSYSDEELMLLYRRHEATMRSIEAALQQQRKTTREDVLKPAAWSFATVAILCGSFDWDLVAAALSAA